MCKECGCEDGGPVHIHGHSHPHPHPHEHEHGHDHSHDLAPPAPEGGPRTVEIHQPVLDRNDRLAERNRGYFRAKGLLVANLVSSPGSGKTTLIQQTIHRLQGRLRTGVIVGDLATENDAIRIRSAGAPAIQITTGTLCHLDAEMVARAAGRLDLDALDLLIIENVGNLVCPAAFDLGEDLRAVLLSVTEGEDKPLKYPSMFASAHAVVINKIDLAEAAGFARDTAHASLRRVCPGARVFELSARTGQGLDAWCDYLAEERARRNAAHPLA